MGESQQKSNSYKFRLGNKGWYRIFKFNSSSYGLFFLNKKWATGEPAPPLISFNRHDVSILLRTENTGNNIQKVRIMKDGITYYIDIWYESDGSLNDFIIDCIIKAYCTFMNANPIEDTTSTLIKEVSLV